MTNSIINNINKDDFADNHFIRTIIENDLANKKYTQIITRFPPEPNGYLHIGHVKSICLNFGLAYIFGGKCNLRFDDTNPEKESEEYVNAIKDNIKWLGFSWDGDVKFASDYFEKLYDFAIELIKKGLAYVDDLSIEKIKDYRGTLTTPGINSPYRNRSIEENLDLFERMKHGEFQDSTKTLRLKIDMTHGNINLRDPIIYRIKHTNHIRTSNKWCIYPMYDYTHPICDALEHITHSLCTLEFEEHRPLYDWIINNISVPSKPRQYEFSRLELLYTITSKRKLNRLVTEGIVSGWDDPRMPTISGMRRRGYTASGLRLFCKRVGISKGTNIIDFSTLETAIRDDLESKVPRMFAVLDPLKVELINFDEEKIESKKVPFHVKNEEFGDREVFLSKYIYIEKDDFSLNPPPKWQRLELGKEVRLRYSYIIKCEEVIKNDNGEVILLKCSIDYDTFGKKPEGRKVKGIVHWLADNNFIEAKVRLYDRLFNVPRPDATKDENGNYIDFLNFINHDSFNEIKALIEPYASNLSKEDRYQFERIGYFVADMYEHSKENPVFNRILTLKDNWQK